MVFPNSTTMYVKKVHFEHILEIKVYAYGYIPIKKDPLRGLYKPV